MNRNLAVFTILLLLLSAVLTWAAKMWLEVSFLLSILVFLFASTWLVFAWMARKNQPEDFVKNYLLSIVLKLLAGGIFIAVIIFSDKVFADSNALFFMVSYLMFTGAEVAFLFKIRNQN